MKNERDREHTWSENYFKFTTKNKTKQIHENSQYNNWTTSIFSKNNSTNHVPRSKIIFNEFVPIPIPFPIIC